MKRTTNELEIIEIGIMLYLLYEVLWLLGLTVTNMTGSIIILSLAFVVSELMHVSSLAALFVILGFLSKKHYYGFLRKILFMH